jgi:putative AdoMet-dependent methyltransferase
MLNQEGFDQWSGGYDQTILNGQDSYPFAGYYKVLGLVQNAVLAYEHPKVLDVGIGTGIISEVLAKGGARIAGIDFSKEMLAQAKRKIPDGDFYQVDFSQPLPEVVTRQKYNCIISTYALHHLVGEKKVNFISQLHQLLAENGKIIVGDIGFETQKAFDQCQSVFQDDWDSGEADGYMIWEVLKPLMSAFEVRYEQISICAGLLTIT